SQCISSRIRCSTARPSVSTARSVWRRAELVWTLSPCGRGWRRRRRVRGLVGSTPHPSKPAALLTTPSPAKGRGHTDCHRVRRKPWSRLLSQPLLIEHEDGVDRVTLNRPESLNALDPGLIDALNGYFQGLQRNRTTRVVVLKGAGQNFCAGLDLKHA